MARRQRRGWGALRRLPSRRTPGRGRWQASYIGRDNRRHKAPHTFADRISAERWLSEERRLLDGGDWTPPADRDVWAAKGETVAVFGERWIRERRLKPRTRALYESQFKLHIEPVFGAVQVRHLTSERVRAWYAALDADYPRRNSQVYALLKSIMETAVSDGVIAANPCQIKGASYTDRKREPIILTVEELGKLAASDKMPDRYRMLVLLAGWCGLRWGEVIELRRKDISVDGSVLAVSRAVGHRKGQCLISTTKTGKARRVVVPPHIREELVRHLQHHVGPQEDGLLFAPARGGCHLNDKVFADSYYRPALAGVGRTGVTVHMLRHFGGTMAAQVGASVIETMDRLGHTTPAASMRYQKAVDQRAVVIAEALSELAKPKPAAEGGE